MFLRLKGWKPHFLRCGAVAIIPRKKTAVAVTELQIPMIQYAVRLRYYVEKNSKMLQDRSLKVRKTCDTCDISDTCHPFFGAN